MDSVKYFVAISTVLMAAENANAQIVSITKNIANGEYAYSYSDGFLRQIETGKLDSEGSFVVTGQYRYVLFEKEYVVTYTADKDGFHPKLTIYNAYKTPLPFPRIVPRKPAQLVASMLGK
ncbi:hypothetical protein ABMA28_015651 [Loxostege sticticalis]|uniref:Uncharacterized protein n=1 Tax=Loxostege sticticalis TaxID=481309 RepID=A0ABD0TAS9_LOXSC